MCSASSPRTNSRMAMATSTIKRSAPRPARSTASPCAMSAAWVTVAPFCMASLVAVVSWPSSVPIMRSRMGFIPSWRPLGTLRPDDFRHGDAELFFDQHDFAARHQAVVDVDVDGLADLAVELEHGAGAEFEQIADVHAGASEHGRDLDRHVEHRFEIFGDPGGRPLRLRGERHVGRRSGVFEIGQRDFAIVAHPTTSSTLGRPPDPTAAATPAAEPRLALR